MNKHIKIDRRLLQTNRNFLYQFAPLLIILLI